MSYVSHNALHKRLSRSDLHKSLIGQQQVKRSVSKSDLNLYLGRGLFLHNLALESSNYITMATTTKRFQLNMDLILPDSLINYELSLSRTLRSVLLCVTESKRGSKHIPAWQTKQKLYFPAITTVCRSPWWVAWQRLGGHGVFCLHSSPLVPTVLWCVNRRNRFHFQGWAAVGWPPLYAHRCPFQLEGIADDMHHPLTTLRLLWVAMRKGKNHT